MGMIQRFKDTIQKGTFFVKLYKHLLQKRHLFYLKDEEIRRVQQNLEIYEHLKKKYGYVLNRERENLERKHSERIWTCWFQGMENAPLLCQRGAARMEEIFGKENVVVITAENYADYCSIPDYIVDKWKQGIISNTHFSDIARYCLLYENGGTWIDATILILDDELPEYFHDSPLFLFADHISGMVPNIQSSFISAYSHSPLIGCVRDLIFEYWRKENYSIDYNMYHFFFQMAEEAYPEEWDAVYRYPNHCTHILRKYLFQPFDEQRYEQIRQMCPVQKLSHKKKSDKDLSGTFYDVLILQGDKFFQKKS